MSSDKTQSGPLVAHKFVRKVFLVPSWCDRCSGILVGQGYECSGPCKCKCHLGEGAGKVENCHADLLLTSCSKDFKHKKGEYKLGDAIQQIGRDFNQGIKDAIVKQAVQEQRDRGKFKILKEVTDEIQKRWNADSVWHVLALLQIFSIAAGSISTYSIVSTFTRQLHTDGIQSTKAHDIAWLQGTTSALSIALVWVAVTLLVYFLAKKIFHYSQLAHAFSREIMNIELEELDIDLGKAASEVADVFWYVFLLSCAHVCVCFALWLRAVTMLA
eukprot:TRINITY_DN109537_c0_g1_i1.p1 TRINITY_DN109537_c0_g1~~TRINITY_DN109537_c0_g1_i1.p1  ORF type:complete len:289 (+),score=40.88 TRINITY_DN109537_c0_g1_i1:53-868(+)